MRGLCTELIGGILRQPYINRRTSEYTGKEFAPPLEGGKKKPTYNIIKRIGRLGRGHNACLPELVYEKKKLKH